MAESDDDWVPPQLFEDSEPSPDTESGTKVLHSKGGWTVVERRRPCGTERWLSQAGAPSLDQTRIDLRPGTEGAVFVRDRLRSPCLQAMALCAALALPGHAERRVCVLGGGGMALPMALLAACPGLEVLVVERDPLAARLARDFFGAEGEGLVVVVAEALGLVTRGELPAAAALLVDIDFLRGAETPPELLSGEFWRAAWASLGPGGVFVLNGLGADAEAIHAVAGAALAQAPCGGTAAGTLEPAGVASGTRWTPLRPRPCALVLGSAGQLRPLAEPPLLAAALEAAAWAGPLVGDFARSLVEGEGPHGRWRPQGP